MANATSEAHEGAELSKAAQALVHWALSSSASADTNEPGKEKAAIAEQHQQQQHSSNVAAAAERSTWTSDVSEGEEHEREERDDTSAASSTQEVPLAGPNAPHWPDVETIEGSRFESVQRKFSGERLSTVAVQTDECELCDIRQLQAEVQAGSSELQDLRQMLWNIRKDSKTREEHEVGRVADEAERRLRKRVEWLENRFAAQLERARSADRESANNRCVLEEREHRLRYERALQALAKRYERDYDSLQQQLQSARNEAMEARIQAQKERTRGDEHARDVQRLYSNIRDMVGESDDTTQLVERIAELRKAKEENEHKVGELEATINSLRKHMTRQSAWVSESENRAEEMCNEREKRIAELERRLHEQEKDSNTRESRLEAERKRLAERLEGLEMDYSRECEIADVLRTKNKEAIDRLSNENATLKQHLNNATEQKEQAEEYIKQLQERLRYQQAQRDTPHLCQVQAAQEMTQAADSVPDDRLTKKQPLEQTIAQASDSNMDASNGLANGPSTVPPEASATTTSTTAPAAAVAGEECCAQSADSMDLPHAVFSQAPKSTPRKRRQQVQLAMSNQHGREAADALEAYQSSVRARVDRLVAPPSPDDTLEAQLGSSPRRDQQQATSRMQQQQNLSPRAQRSNHRRPKAAQQSPLFAGIGLAWQA